MTTRRDTASTWQRNAARALTIEIEGLRGLHERLDASFGAALQKMHTCAGKVVVSGMGKSGHVGRKIAATLASTGTPSFFLHPAEALHGDLGMVTASDVALLLSNSGETSEVIQLLAPLRRMGVGLISMTGVARSTLAGRADVHLHVGVAAEACPLGLAPTASTTAAMVMGDLLAVCLLEMKQFSAEDYALFHPGGQLGKKLMTTVGDIMIGGARLPAVPENTPLREALRVLQSGGFGLVCVTDAEGRLCGAFSMGDVTRLTLSQEGLPLGRPIAALMNRHPKAVPQDFLAARALHQMETARIRALFVIDEDHRPVGILGIYETLAAVNY